MSEKEGKKVVPVVDSIDAFATTTQQRVRVDAVVVAFEKEYGSTPSFVARAPGRINIIGEHIDYSDYGVLPMAVDNDFMIACKPNKGSSTLNIRNIDSKFPSKSIASWPVDIDSTQHDWVNYFLAGYRGILESVGCETPIGMDVLVQGNVPMGAGLSSSSAFVVCASLTSLHANGISIPQTDLATFCAKAEHYVGTEGGGMDQSISIMAEEGVAMYIQFNPIRATPVTLPKGGLYVVANSCVEAHKQKTASTHFNKRVVECRSAAMILAKKLGLENPLSFRKMAHVQKASGKSLDEMVEYCDEQLSPEPYSQESLAEELGVSLDELKKDVLSPTTQNVQDLELKKRALHVFAEANRVLLFQKASTLEEMGALLDGSQKSMSELYDCSCEELDTLTRICKEGGALGSRLTGAGWGGCTISLVKEDNVDAFLQHLKDNYYTTDKLRAQVPSALFATSAGPGARILTF